MDDQLHEMETLLEHFESENQRVKDELINSEKRNLELENEIKMVKLETASKEDDL